VVDAGTGEVLHQVNADTRNYPASLTKMMTLYLAFEALDRGRLKMDQTLSVSRRAQSIKVKDAILALVTKSANDAAVVIAEALAGSEIKFAQKMTAKARALGMTRTNFRNASGLPNRRQLSTARDMARLAQALIEDYPQFYTYFSTEKFTYKGRTYSNHNSLLRRYAGTDGLKTGYTRASGFNLAASSLRDGRRLIAVVFGGKTASSRDRHITGLLDKGFASPTMTRPLTARAGPAVAPPPRKPASLAAVPTPMHKPENLIAGSAAGATARTTAVLVAPRKKPEGGGRAAALGRAGRRLLRCQPRQAGGGQGGPALPRSARRNPDHDPDHQRAARRHLPGPPHGLERRAGAQRLQTPALGAHRLPGGALARDDQGRPQLGSVDIQAAAVAGA
jgi:D-alanyl-D-alanine carboxypeptidase